MNGEINLKKEALPELSSIFLRVVNRYNEIEKMPYSYGTDTLLHPSETHTIECIGDNPNINVTHLADLLGITKGAVSKRVQKLRLSGLVTKSISPNTENEVIISLTDKGVEIYQAHAKFSEQLNKSIMRLYSKFSDDVIMELEKVGTETEELFLKIANERKKR